MSGFDWTKIAKQGSMRRYGVEVEYDTEDRRQCGNKGEEIRVRGRKLRPDKSNRKAKARPASQRQVPATP